MPYYINRSDFDALSQEEKTLRLAEGTIVREDDWKEREIRAERVRAETAEWNAYFAPNAISRSEFNRMSLAERDQHIKAGGVVTD